MMREKISDAIGGISTRHIQEAANYVPGKKKTDFFKLLAGKSIIAAVLTLCLFVTGLTFFLPGSMGYQQPVRHGRLLSCILHAVHTA